MPVHPPLSPDNVFVWSFSGIAGHLALCRGLHPVPLSIENQVKLVAEETVNQISIITESIKSHDLEQEAPTSVTAFIQRELAYFQNLLDDAIKDLELLINACSGLDAFTPGLFNLAMSLGNRRTPSKWLKKCVTDVGLADWLMNLGKQVDILGKYLPSSPLDPSSFCLGSFAHPQAFLACVLMDHARSAMKSVYALEFSVEVLENLCVKTVVRFA